MTFLSLFKHLLPRSRVWNITTPSNLRRFFLGLAWAPQAAREYIDAIWWDQFSAYTSRLEDQERQWGLAPITANEATRRARLAARKADTGGNSLSYIQAALQALGFPVYVHPFFSNSPSVPPVPPVVRDPRAVIADSPEDVQYIVQAGEPIAQAGEPTAQAGDTTGPAGYLLVNIIEKTRPIYTVQAGEPVAQAGEPDAQAGAFDFFEWIRQNYTVPDDPAAWPRFAYIGGQIYGDQAIIPAARRRDFETAVLRLCPTGLWLGVMVNYN